MRLARSAPRPSPSPFPVSSPPDAFSLLARSAGDNTPRDHAAGCRCAAPPPALAGRCSAGGRARHCSAPAPPGWKAAPQYSIASDSIASSTVLHAPILPQAKYPPPLVFVKKNEKKTESVQRLDHVLLTEREGAEAARCRQGAMMWGNSPLPPYFRPVCWRGALNCRGTAQVALWWCIAAAGLTGALRGAGQKKIRFENEKYLRAHPELAQVHIVAVRARWVPCSAALPLRSAQLLLRSRDSV